ncbi:phosphonate C-P lyase system protein PhnL [Terasakiella sp. A23]|uniref:phosphonate C-P lyase system protein PhnL n=1 Tax=Terasakiella sp. FCG-A23 TaxID=3080561 RepID=UPI002953483B|nr:phosphonate C-P lyase system protein PhnL [Terasakiella sp. A23]MDV7340330.1 phosphonate C-P lyase system protein PhnL [Terasakiella sp. A23]
MSEMLNVENVAKSFTLHTQGALTIPVFEKINFSLNSGECIALTGVSGAGKSTFMRMVYANYICSEGSIRIRHNNAWMDLVSATPHQVIDVRKRTLGYVSQFLRVIPRVPTLDIVAEPLIATGVAKETALEKARTLLTRLRIPQHLWNLSPLTFSGGEQQRVNIARGFVVDYPIMLLDEPTASLDAENRRTVLDLIEEAKGRGCAVLGIFHDQDARDAVCTDTFDVTQYQVSK